MHQSRDVSNSHQKRDRGGRGSGRRPNYHNATAGRHRNVVAYSMPVPDCSENVMTSKVQSNSNGNENKFYLNVAVQGCAHGALDEIYAEIERKKGDDPVDLLICCGDFQALRNEADYDTIAMPKKYKSMGDFYKYYKGEKSVPVPTVFIGGNHEASAYMQELCYGGWAAKGIYFMGYAGVIKFGGIRIAGISGIFKGYSHTMGHYEFPPYGEKDVRSVYHTRNMEVYRLAQLTEPIDIFISHDWPRGIEQFGNTAALIRKKAYFRQEIRENNLGSPANEFLMKTLKPKWWFSAHLHVKFEASVTYELSKNESRSSKTDQSTSFLGLESEPCYGAGTTLTEQMTKFLALDKCMPKRQFLQLLKIERPKSEDSSTPKFEYDLEWLTVLRKTHDLTKSERKRVQLPSNPVLVTLDDKRETSNLMKKHSLGRHEKEIFMIPLDFVMTVPPYPEGSPQESNHAMCGNPQTDLFLSMLNLDHIITLPFSGSRHETVSNNDENEIDLTDSNGSVIEDQDQADLRAAMDASEINIDDVSEEENLEVVEENEELPYDNAKKARIITSTPL